MGAPGARATVHPMATSTFHADLGDGIFAIDTGFHRDRFDASFLIVDSGRAAFVDTGTALAVPRLLATLDALGLGRDAVDFVIPTHVHLDHAGGVGTLMQHLPAAQVRVHPRGLRHLVDPTDLYQGALAVYGPEQMARDYGVLVGVPEQRAAATADGETIHLGTRPLQFAHTPGHARHHHCVWDERSQGWFTGDTFGIGYPELTVDGRAFVFPTSTPVQFEPQALHDSIDRMLARTPRWMFLTHFGRIGHVAETGRTLKRLLDDAVRIARAHAGDPDRQRRLAAALTASYVEAAHAHGVALSATEIGTLLQLDAYLNAMGLGVWLDRPTRG